MRWLFLIDELGEDLDDVDVDEDLSEVFCVDAVDSSSMSVCEDVYDFEPEDPDEVSSCMQGTLYWHELCNPQTLDPNLYVLYTSFLE